MRKTSVLLAILLFGATAVGANETAYVGKFPSSDAETKCGIFLDKEGKKSGPTYESLIALVQKKPEASASVLRFLKLPVGTHAELALYRLAFRTTNCGSSIPIANEISSDCDVVSAIVSDLNNVVFRLPSGRTKLFPAECTDAIDPDACAQSIRYRGRTPSTRQ